MTVNDIIRELDFCKKVINCVEDVRDKHPDFDNIDSLEDAVDIIGKYMDELGRKQIK